ncbi:MAG: hypothetical protein BroJett001_32690 [Chloroflexota bacterium]|nr:MAG: hypothetical protein BroJett001_32690 [Chloroflexota bacterium]
MVLTWAGGPIDTRITFTLADAPGGCRLVVEQVGFKGLRAWIVSRILAIGSRAIYGRRLPEVLSALDPESQTAAGRVHVARSAVLGAMAPRVTLEEPRWQAIELS